MAIDTPATIGILGAGPVGLEAALYARFLGFDVLVFERGEVADHVRQWGHVRMFSPFAMNRSPLGLAAIAAQDESYRAPADDALLTGAEWREQYLLPLAGTDLLADPLRLGATVDFIGRTEFLKGDAIGDERRGEDEFRIVYRDDQGEHEATVDAVIDTSGVFGQPNWLGTGGAPALGERQLAGRIWRGLPDILGRDRERFANRCTLVVGSGYSAATTIAALAELRTAADATSVHWVTRHSAVSPIARIPDDRLPARDAVAAAAGDAAAGDAVQWHPGVSIGKIRECDESLHVELSNEHELVVDEVVSHTGFHVDSQLHRELQVHQCYATEGPMKLAAALVAVGSDADCLNQQPQEATLLCNPEPNFYILGAKSYGRNSQFLVQTGLEQIRELFALIGDRPSLDLYGSVNLQDSPSS